jgi:transcriptional regulator with XRE-family HTH domain
MVSDFTRFLIRLKIYRSGKEVTQQAMADHLGISLRSYQRLEQGIVPLDAQYLPKICEILNISYKQLMEPKHRDKEFNKVSFYGSLEELISREGLENKVSSLSQTICDMHKVVFEDKLPIRELAGHPSFVTSQDHLFYTTPSSAWVNPATVNSYNPTRPQKFRR